MKKYSISHECGESDATLNLGREMLYLSRAQVESLDVAMLDIVASVEEAFTEKGAGRVEMPPKPGIHPLPDAFIHAMPAHIPKLGAAGVKWVSGFPQNMSKGLPYISGLLILNDPETGFPISVMDCTWITAKRTGAATAVAAKYLANSNSRVVAILGCGVQGYSNWEALKAVFPQLDCVKAYDSNPPAAKLFSEKISTDRVEVTVAKDPREACFEADIVVTAGPILECPSPIIERRWLKEGVFLSPVDFDSYLQPDIFNDATKLYTDDLVQQRYYRDVGYFKGIRTPDGDLSEVIVGQKPGRTNGQEMTVALNLGIALEDMAAAILVYRAAMNQRIGQIVQL